MNYELFKDILPNYIEGLTSDSTNKEIEKYMSTSKKAQTYFQQMKTNIEISDKDEYVTDQYAYTQFKKINKMNRKRLLLVASLISLFFILLFLGYVYLFGTSWTSKYQDVTLTKHFSKNTTTIVIKPKNNRHFLLPYNDISSKNNREFDVNEMRKDLSTPKILEKGIVVKYKFKDNYTLIDVHDKEVPITEENYLKIKFKDTTKVFKIVDLYKQKEKKH